MRLRNIKNKEEIIKNSPYIVENSEEYKGKWSKLFNNNNPIYIEIGMGMGKFIRENAIKHPDINYKFYRNRKRRQSFSAKSSVNRRKY